MTAMHEREIIYERYIETMRMAAARRLTKGFPQNQTVGKGTFRRTDPSAKGLSILLENSLV